ncbi:MAG: EamA family transporter [Clostridia bacterium]|nr:EamA family transporter [Clostridia bacterium]
MNYIVFACLSAIFAALTSILAKMGMKNLNSNLATALRCIVVVAFSWLMAFITTDIPTEFSAVTYKTVLFLILSGFATGASWMCYFHALKIGNVNLVVPIDKSAVAITMLLSFLIFPDEKFTLLKLLCIALIAIGTFLMIEKKKRKSSKAKRSAILYAFMGAVFAALTSILGKIGIEGISSDFGSAIRCIVVLVMAWIIVLSGKSYRSIKSIDTKSGIFIILSGIATGASWLCYYRALSAGPASVVVPLDKLSILFTVLFSYIFLGEKLTKKSLLGLILIVTGTLLLVIC